MIVQIWDQRAKTTRRGLCTLSRGPFGPCRVSQFWPLPPAQACYPARSPYSHPLPLLFTILSPVCPRCCSLSLSFFLPFFCESSVQVRTVISQPLPFSSIPLHPAHSPACPFERLVKNHDDRQRRLSSIATLLYSRYIAPIALSTWHATLFRHSRLVSRSLVTLLHPKSLHFRV